MEARNGHDRINSNITGEYTLFDNKANGRNYYHNDEANRFLYSSPKGIWFVCEQYRFWYINIIILHPKLF